MAQKAERLPGKPDQNTTKRDGNRRMRLTVPRANLVLKFYMFSTYLRKFQYLVPYDPRGLTPPSNAEHRGTRLRARCARRHYPTMNHNL